jgi:hypothetical protein
MIAVCYWVFPPSETRFTVLSLVFALGSLTFLVKGVFLLRKSSERLGLSEQELAKLSNPAVRKTLPPLLTQAAQVVQDFGTGALLLWPFLILGKDFDNSWSDPPRFRVFLAGAFIFSLGWVIRRLTSSPTAQGCARPFAPFHIYGNAVSGPGNFCHNFPGCHASQSDRDVLFATSSRAIHYRRK